MDKASPLADGQLRHKSGAGFGGPTVTVVKMTPLSFIPGAKITKYLGIINMFLIRETTSLREVRQKNEVDSKLLPMIVISKIRINNLSFERF